MFASQQDAYYLVFCSMHVGTEFCELLSATMFHFLHMRARAHTHTDADTHPHPHTHSLIELLAATTHVIYFDHRFTLVVYYYHYSHYFFYSLFRIRLLHIIFIHVIFLFLFHLSNCWQQQLTLLLYQVRQITGDVKPCIVPPSAHELEVLKVDDALQSVR
jgi:hypothetical protein